jgi:hypothetical protein
MRKMKRFVLFGLLALFPGVAFGDDPTIGLLSPASDGYANWSITGMQMPITASISGTTLTATYAPSLALGPGQTISGAGIAPGTQIAAFGTGTGGKGTYTVNNSQTVASESMIASGIPNRTTVYKMLSPTGSDDTAQINAAIASCPAGEVVLLTTGVFRISGQGVQIWPGSGNANPGCTLRGSGPGQQLSTGLNKVDGGGVVRACASGTLTTIGDGSFCTDPAATQLIKVDRATDGGDPVIQLQPIGLYASPVGSSYTLASDAVQGGYSVTLKTAPTKIHVGDIVGIDEYSDHDPNVNWGYEIKANAPGAYEWFELGTLAATGGNRPHRSLAQLFEVAAINGNTVTFDTPIDYPYHTSATCTSCDAQLVRWSGGFGSFVHGFGVEDLFAWGGMGGGNVQYDSCAYCWIKDVEAAWVTGSNIQINEGFRNVLRDSFVHETASPNPGGNGYLLLLSQGTSETLVENNILWFGNKVDLMKATGGGNVFSYNYADDAFGDSYPDQPEAGANAGHYTTPHMELLEGNYSQNFKGDGYWGPSIYITAFRNWFSAHRAAHPPLDTYTNSDNGCLATYGDYSGFSRPAVDVQAYSFYNNFIGNVLGTNNQQLLTEPGSNPCFGPQTAWTLFDATTDEYNKVSSGNIVPVWQFGTDQNTQAEKGVYSWTFVPTTINTQTLTANWDWYTKAEHCYAYGTTNDSGCAGVTVPASFYLASKPAFFGTQVWPWVDPTTGATYILPAKYCFEQGKMPNCLE